MTTPLRGQLKLDEPMARHTSWKVGGPARRFYQPADLADLQVFMVQLAEAEPVYFTGLGSNLLVRDGGFDGTVVCLQPGLKAIDVLQQTDNTVSFQVEAGASCAKVAKFGNQHGLLHSEFFAGIPGTIGGALAMNAGAFGGETWSYVQQVQTVDRQGRLHTRGKQDYQISYRHLSARQTCEEWFVSAELCFDRDDQRDGKHLVKNLLAKRASSQPTGVLSCGSVFTNPEGDHAARLIEAAGLKGYRIGGAHISEKHANFFLNDQQATAADLEQLIRHAQDTVLQQFGVQLHPEVKTIGEAA